MYLLKLLFPEVTLSCLGAAGLLWPPVDVTLGLFPLPPLPSLADTLLSHALRSWTLSCYCKSVTFFWSIDIWRCWPTVQISGLICYNSLLMKHLCVLSYVMETIYILFFFERELLFCNFMWTVWSVFQCCWKKSAVLWNWLLNAFPARPSSHWQKKKKTFTKQEASLSLSSGWSMSLPREQWLSVT